MIRIIIIGLLVILLGSAGYFYFFAERQGPAPVPVKLFPVQQGRFTASVLAHGKFIARKKESLASPIAGVVHDKGFMLGQFLSKGSVVASISLLETEMLKKQQDFEFAKIDLEILNEQFQQSEELLHAKAVSEREFKELKIRKYKQEKLVQNLQDELSDKRIRTGFNGVLVEKLFRDGDRVSAGAVLCTIVDPRSFAVEVTVPQHIIADVKVGQRVQYSSETFRGERWGTVLEIARVADKQSSQYGSQYGPASAEPEFTVVATIEHSTFENFLLGSKVDARFVLAEKLTAVFVPSEAILYRNDTTAVFIASNGTARRQYVILGLANDRFVEIRNGVHPGDTVITVGNLDVEEGNVINNIEHESDNHQPKPRSRPIFFAP